LAPKLGHYMTISETAAATPTKAEITPQQTLSRKYSNPYILEIKNEC